MVGGRLLWGGVWAARALLFAALFVTSRAQAQYAAPVFVQVNAGERAFSVSLPQGRHERGKALVECARVCGFWAYPGTYQVHVNDAGNDVNVRLRVRGPGNYAFVPANTGPRTAGLVLGIAGPVVTLAGVFMVVAGAYQSSGSCSDDGLNRSCGTPAISYYGAATFVAGLGMTTAGWILYAYNRDHFKLGEARPLQPASARLGLIPLPHAGLGFGATVTF